MTLNQFAAERRMAILEDLANGLEPRAGSFDRAALRLARAKGSPQMGVTRFSPTEVLLEFIFPDSLGAPAVLAVTVESPERIVFLPVPSWVVENIWQGDVSGTHHFESDAMRLLRELESELTPASNRKWFERPVPKRRE